jgi:hypothetical protein
MGALLKRPVLLGILAGILLLILCIFVPIPMYDGIFHYDYELVHVQTEGKIALSYYFGIGLEQTRANGILPNHFELKPIGYVLLIMVHIGLPALIAIRFRMSNARKKLEQASDE